MRLLILLLVAVTGSVQVHVDAQAAPSAMRVVEADAATDFGAVMRGIRPRGFGQGTYTLLAPTGGGGTLYVATSGSDSNPGTSSAPFLTINKAAQVAVAGDVVMIGPGTYSGSVLVRNAGTAASPIVFQAERRGEVVLTGGQYNFQPTGWTGGKIATHGNVWLRGLSFRNYASLASGQAAVRAVNGWQIEDCFFDSPGRNGLDLRGDDILLTRTTIQDAFHHAFVAWGPANGATGPADPRFEGSRNLRILDNVWRRNYAATMSTGAGSAVVKVLGSKGALVENNEAYDNRGPGFWFDAMNSNYIVRHNYFHDQINLGAGHSASAGLHIEISWAPGLVEHNVFANNANEGVGIDNSSGVTVRENLFYGNRRGIVLSNFDRGAAFPLKDVRIEANQFKDWREYAAIERLGHIAPGDLGALNLLVDANVYQPIRSAWLSGWWGGAIGAISTINGLRTSLGWEQHGRIGPISWPP